MLTATLAPVVARDTCTFDDLTEQMGCRYVRISTLMPTAPSTETIYVRVPEATKTAAKDYAETNGMTLTGAISELLERGLEAIEDADSISRLQSQLQAKDVELQEAAARVRGLQALATTPLGVCASCKAVITAEDVLVRSKCPNGHPLRAPAASNKPTGSGLDDNQALILIGAVGLLLGALALSNSTG